MLVAAAVPTALSASLSWPTLGVAGTGFVLGCRHGLDWDHIAAITDLTTATTDQPPPASQARQRWLGPHGHRRPSSLGLAVWYCLGHGLVIALLGAAVGILGLDLPPGLDRVFESVVGGTLVLLGGVVLWQLGRDRGTYQYAGRVRLIVGTVRRAWSRARRRGTGPAQPLDDLNRRAAFGVGVLHGTGAETPTQVVLFASAGAAGSSIGAVVILLSFLTGLILSDVGIAAAWFTGLLGARRLPAVQIALGALAGLSSLAVGGLFIAGHSAVLPAVLGG
jgi:high-affinity nickel-transport protein